MFEIFELSDSVQVTTKCGQYFGYDTIPVLNEKRVSFNYGVDDRWFIKSVVFSNLHTKIDNSKEKPTVVLPTPSEIIITISQGDYEKEKECLPAPEEPST